MTTTLQLAMVALLTVIAGALIAIALTLGSVVIKGAMNVIDVPSLAPDAPSTQEFHVVPLDDITRKV